MPVWIPMFEIPMFVIPKFVISMFVKVLSVSITNMRRYSTCLLYKAIRPIARGLNNFALQLHKVVETTFVNTGSRYKLYVH